MNPLQDIIPAAARRYFYAAFALAGLIVGALTIAGVDVGKAPDVLTFIGIGLGATAASNTGSTDEVDERGAVDSYGLLVVVLLVLILLGVLGYLHR